MIAIASDHGGFELKEAIKEYLEENSIEYKDFGTLDGSKVDYPIIAKEAASSVANGECEKGIICCGTGIGVSIAANKIKGIRAACVSDCYSAKLTREHNDANVLCMGGRVVGPGLGVMMVDLFLNTPFEGGRHQRRIDMLKDIEDNKL